MLRTGYIDLKAAFDSVDRKALWKALAGIKLPVVESILVTVTLPDSAHPQVLDKGVF